MADKAWTKKDREDFQKGMMEPTLKMKRGLNKLANFLGVAPSPEEDDRSIAEMVNTAVEQGVPSLANRQPIERHAPDPALAPLDEEAKRSIYMIGNKTRVPEWDKERMDKHLKSYTEGRNEELSRYRQENPLPENATDEQAKKWLEDYDVAKKMILKRQALDKLSNEELERRTR